MDWMWLLTHIHHILNLWVDDERATLYDTCRLWRMLEDHILPGPITGFLRAFTNPKTKPDPRRDSTVSPSASKNKHKHFTWVLLFILLWLKWEEEMGCLSRAGKRDDTQIGNSRETKPNDLDISLCGNASGLSTQLKHKGDRQEGKGKTKIDLNLWRNRAECPLLCQMYTFCF